MILLIGGNGYIGTNFVQTYPDRTALQVIDPTAPVCSFLEPIYSGHTAGECEFGVGKFQSVVWLAGPRNTRKPRDVLINGRMIEDQFRQLIKQLPRDVRIVLLSSMSVHDHDDNEYAQHKRRMEELLTAGRDAYTIIRPGTVIGACHPREGPAVLREDLAVHKILRAFTSTPITANVNCAVHRVYARIETITAAITAGIRGSGKFLDEAYDSLSSMPALFTQLDDSDRRGLHMFWDNDAPSFCGEAGTDAEGRCNLQIKVRRTLELIRKEKVIWV